MKKLIGIVALLLIILLNVFVPASAFAAEYDTEMKVGETKTFYFSGGSLGTVYGYNWYIPDTYSQYAKVTSKTTTSCVVLALRPGEFEVIYWMECDNYGSVSANWSVLAKAAGYTVSFDANGGQNQPANLFQEEGQSITLSTTIPRRDGYMFQGWYYNGNFYQPGGTYTFNSDVTLTASWEFDHYVIKYNANGGSAAPASQNKYPGQPITISSDVPSRQGYIFLGWATSASATIAECQPGEKLYLDEFMTLYAVWEKITVERVELNKSELKLMFDESYLLKATVYPAEASQAITWSSSNTSVATVSSLGTVTAVGSGTAVITATATDQKIARCTVTVTPDPLKIVELSSANFVNYYFRNYLIDEYDRDGNGYLGETEIALITELDDLPNNTASLKGIQYLTSLQYVDVSGTRIYDLDISGCASIKRVKAADSTVAGIEYFCLETFRADGCPSLSYVDLWSTGKVTSIYINNCPSLNYLRLSNNEKVKSITLKGCPALETLAIPAISVDLSECYSLRELGLWNYSGTQKLTKINLRNCPALISLVKTGTKEVWAGMYQYRNEKGDSLDIASTTSLIIDTDLVMLKQPVSVDAEVNKSVSFFAAATGDVVTFQWQEKKGTEWVDIANQNAMKLSVKAQKSKQLRCKVTDQNGKSIYSDEVSLTVSYPSFGTADFALPDNLRCIEQEAFEGIRAKAIAIPASCTRIEEYAFRNSKIEKIRVPKQCSLGTDVFEGCSFVCIYGTKGSAAEDYCLSHDNCVFIAE